MREARDADLISRSPAESIGLFKAKTRDRGILNNDEVKKLFSEESIKDIWAGDRRIFTAHLLLASTGLRLGELQGLQIGDVLKDRIQVIHAWERKAGLKSPKWDSARFVPLPERTMLHLREMIEGSPFTDASENLVFYGRTFNTPMAQSYLANQFYKALGKIGISEQERQRRGIVVHSWRRWFITTLRSGGIEDSKIRALTGHKSAAMTDLYTNFGAEHFEDAISVQEGMFL